jgi:hypothetical protein
MVVHQFFIMAEKEIRPKFEQQILIRSSVKGIETLIQKLRRHLHVKRLSPQND